MAHPKHPLFPENIGPQVADLNTKKKYLNANGNRLGIPPAELTTIDLQVDAVNTAQAAVNNVDTRTKLNTATRNMAVLTAQITLRRVIEFYVVGNANATPVDYAALRIPQPGPRPPLPQPASIPGLRRLISTGLAVLASFFDIETGKRAKPPGVQSIEACYRLGGEPPEDVASMTGRTVATASPLRIRFDFADEFKPLYIAFRWIGTRGDFGPWSEIHKIIIVR
jgi:hypothetical protein